MQGLFHLQNVQNLSYYNNAVSSVLVIIRVAFWISTAGKSAQFSFHPWLTSAIEGPTPVRRLLHRSTMVVAGVYLLLKLHPLIISINWLELNSLILFSRAGTIVFTSMWAISQIDIKKIIALSTTSQLRLIIILCCISHYDLAFLHIILHGFFKALLFLGGGVTIHNSLSNNQDIIKLNLQNKRCTFLHTTFLIGVLGLIGAPFIGAFHSKHLIIDEVQYISSLSLGSQDVMHQIGYIRTLAYFGLYISPILTLGYSLKLLLYIRQGSSSVTKSSSYIKGYYHSDLKVTFPLSLIATFSFVVGLIIRQKLVRGKFTIISLEDIFFSLFLFVLFLSLLYYIFYFQSSIRFLYHRSGSIVKFNILFVRDLLTLFLFQLLENLILKKGLKSLLPSFNFKNGQSFLLGDWFSLKSAISAYLFNLTIAVLSIGLLFTFLIC